MHIMNFKPSGFNCELAWSACAFVRHLDLTRTGLVSQNNSQAALFSWLILGHRP